MRLDAEFLLQREFQVLGLYTGSIKCDNKLPFGVSGGFDFDVVKLDDRTEFTLAALDRLIRVINLIYQIDVSNKIEPAFSEYTQSHDRAADECKEQIAIIRICYPSGMQRADCSSYI